VFQNSEIRATDNGSTGYHGMNVTFHGTYKRVSS
jgi:hypothetical protein